MSQLLKLTNEIIDKRLLDSGHPIRRLGSYDIARQPIEWACIVPDCGFIWKAEPNSIKQGTGCPICSREKVRRNKTLTNQIIDSRLISSNRPIRRLDDYIDAKAHIEWLCLKPDCGYIWPTTYDIIHDGSGCPACGIYRRTKSSRLQSDEVDRRLAVSGHSVRRLAPYMGVNVPIDWMCMKVDCGYIWSSTLYGVLHCKIPCPACREPVAKQPPPVIATGRKPHPNSLSNLILDERLLKTGRLIRRLGNFVNTKTKIDFQCLITTCNYTWPTRPEDILNGKGCPQCAGKVPYSNSLIDQRLKDNDIQIKRLGDCIDSLKNIAWQCSQCQHEWNARPAHVINGDSGCPLCSLPGQNEKLMHGLLKNDDIEYEPQFLIKKIDSNVKAYRLDAYLPTISLAIEYNGKQHYYPTGFGRSDDPEKTFIGQQKRDEFIRQFCIDHDIELIEIDGRRLNGVRFTEYMIDELIPYIQSKLANRR